MTPYFQNPCFCSTNRNDGHMMVNFKIHPIMSTHMSLLRYLQLPYAAQSVIV